MSAAALRAYNNADNDADKKRLIRSCSPLRPTWFDTLPTLNRVCLLLVSLQLRKPWATTLHSAVAKPASEFKKKTAPGKNDKLKDANTIQKIDGWRALIFSRLVDVNSP